MVEDEWMVGGETGKEPMNPYAQQPYYPFPQQPPQMPPRKRGLSTAMRVLIICGGLVLLGCAGFCGFAGYVGSVGPETKVYAGNEVPKRFTDVINELDLLESGENVRFFFSDALTDVRKGMYFVTDRKVVVYIESAVTPATVVPFAKIAEAELKSGTSWIDDGAITLHLKDGSVVVFPVSPTDGRDKLMFEAIRVAPSTMKSAGNAAVAR